MSYRMNKHQTGVLILLLWISVGQGIDGGFSSSLGCPNATNSVCVNDYLQLVRCFRDLQGNHENISYAFFPTNQASSLYVSVEYTIQYTDDVIVESGNTLNTSTFTEEWVWSNTVVYILFHPTIFKYLSIIYGNVDDRVSNVWLTIPTLCHDVDRHRLIERLTQMLKHFTVKLRWDTNEEDYQGRSFRVADIEDKLGPAMEIMIVIVYLFGYVALRGVHYIMKHLDMKIEKAIESKAKVYGTVSVMVVCNIHSLLMLIFSCYSYYVYSSGYFRNHTYKYFHHMLPFFYLADPIFTVLVLLFTLGNVKWRQYRRRGELCNAVKKYIVYVTFTLITVLYAIHIMFILLALIAEPLSVLAFGLFVSAMVAYTHMAISIVLLRMQRMFTKNYKKMKEGRLKILLLFRQVLHGIRVLLYFITVFTLTILIRWLLLQYLTAVEYKTVLTSVSLSGLISIVTLSLKYSLKWSKENHSSTRPVENDYIEFHDSDDQVDDNAVIAMHKLGFRKSNLKAFRFSKLQPSKNAYEMEQLSSLQSV